MAKAKETETALAVQNQSTAVMPFEMDAADFGAGREDISAKDVALPFIAVIQSNSPQLKKGGEKHIPGAEMGMFFNTATNTVYDGDLGIKVVPAAYRRAVVEWNHRDNGSGWVATHPADYIDQVKDKTYEDGDGRLRFMVGKARDHKRDTVLVETGYFFVVVVDADGNVQDKALMALSSTQWKAARTWNSLITSQKVVNPATGEFVPAPMFSQVYQLNTALQKNEQGEWYGLSVKHVGVVPNKGVYEEAKRFREFAKTATVNPAATAEDSEDDDSANVL